MHLKFGLSEETYRSVGEGPVDCTKDSTWNEGAELRERLAAMNLPIISIFWTKLTMLRVNSSLKLTKKDQWQVRASNTL